MLPEHQLSTTPVSGKFLYPTGLAKTPLEWYEMGGIALQDASQGLRYQAWHATYDSETGDVSLKGLSTEEESVIFNEPDVTELSFCFDQNMRWAAVVKLEDGTVKFRWYDTVAGTYTVTTYDDTYRSPKLTLDDKRALSITTNDMLLTYLREDKLCVREQRDRFTIEYVLYEDLDPSLHITAVGMTDRGRIQWGFARFRR